METTNKTTEHGVHNSKIHDNAAKIVFGDSTLCAQFLKGYTDIPFFTNIKPEDIEDVSSHFIPLFQESRDSDIVKKILIKNSIFRNSLIFQGLPPIKYQNLMYFPLFLPL